MAPVFFYIVGISDYLFQMDPTLLGYLTDFDRSLFLKINSEWTNPVFDFIFPFLTDLNRRTFMIPIILFALGAWVAMKRSRALVWILVLIVSVSATDFISYRVIKSTADRARPEQAGLPVILRTSHHSGSSFPSNHAANAFAAAGILSAAFPPAAPALYLVAAMIAYSRVYVGVHFPSDVLAGALIGWLIAFIVRQFLRKMIEKGELGEANRLEREERELEKARRKKLMRR